jgi:hypothetical protein
VLIFYCAGEKFGEVTGVFLTLVLAASDAGPERPIYCQLLKQAHSEHRTLTSDAGKTLFACLVWYDVSQHASECF